MGTAFISLTDTVDFGGADTASNVNIGTADSDRLVVATIFNVDVSDPNTGLTINGVTATAVSGAACSGGASHSSVYMAKVPTGTLVDVVLSPGGYLNARGVFCSVNCTESAATAAAACVVNDASGATDPLNVPVTLAGAGNLVVVGGCQNGSAVTLAGVEQTDYSGDAFSNEWYAFGSSNDVTGSLTPSMSGHGTSNACVVACAFELTAPASSPTGTYAGTLPVPTMVASGDAVTAVTGTAAVTLPIPTMSASGQLGHTGTMSITLPVPTMSASGSVSAGVSGTLSVALPLPAMTAAGVLGHTGTASITLPLPTMSASGEAKHTGTVSITLPIPTMSASGSASAGVSGTLSVALPIPTMSAAGELGHTGTLSITLPTPNLSATGTASTQITGTAAVTLPVVTMSATGTAGDAITGAYAGTLPIPTMTATGTAILIRITVEQAVRGLLVQDSAVANLVSDRVFQVLASSQAQLPMVVMFNGDDRPYRLLSRAAGLSVASMQLNIYADTQAEVAALAEAVRLALDNFTGIVTTDDGTLQITQLRHEATYNLAVTVEYGEDINRKGRVMEFAVSYPQTIATH